MGIYLFNRDTLVDLLTKTDYHDFGKEIFPTSIRTHRVQVHLFDGYWEDIGTISRSTRPISTWPQPDPPFELTSAEAPIYSHAAVPAAVADRGGHDPQQPDRRRLRRSARAP